MSVSAALEDLDWPESVQAEISRLALLGRTFSADDLRLNFRPAPHGSMVGPAFSAARRAGIIRHTGYKESTTPSRKHSVIKTWRGVTEGVIK